MAFFQKLKDRLFKSSSKLGEGLDAIIDEAPAESAPEAVPAPVAMAPEPKAEAPAPASAPASASAPAPRR